MILLNASRRAMKIWARTSSTDSKTVPKSTWCEVTACYCCGLMEWGCWRFCSTVNDSTNDLDVDDDGNRNPHVDYNALCTRRNNFNHNSSFYSVCLMSCYNIMFVMCLNDWKKALDVESKCKWINWESKELLLCMLAVDRYWFLCGISNKNINRCGYLNCKAQMKGILCPISSLIHLFAVLDIFQLLN